MAGSMAKGASAVEAIATYKSAHWQLKGPRAAVYMCARAPTRDIRLFPDAGSFSVSRVVPGGNEGEAELSTMLRETKNRGVWC